MSQEREINTPSGIPKTLTKEIINSLSDEQLDAQVASVLDRGMTNARLLVPLPVDLHGEWVPNDVSAIYEKQLLGFEIDDKYALKHALNNDGNGKSIIGDVVHMVAPKRLVEAVERKRRKDYDMRHGPGANKKRARQIEEQGFLNQGHGGLGITEESNVQEISTNEIIAARAASMANDSSNITT